MRNSKYLWEKGASERRVKKGSSASGRWACNPRLLVYGCALAIALYMCMLLRHGFLFYSKRGRSSPPPLSSSSLSSRLPDAPAAAAAATQIASKTSWKAVPEDMSSSVDHIFIDWLLPSSRLTAVNYMALESLVALYPQAVVTLNPPPPRTRTETPL